MDNEIFEETPRRYFLAHRYEGAGHNIAISDVEFRALYDARESLIRLATIEENWSAIVQNFIAFESAVLEAATQNMVLSGQDYFWFQELRLRLAVLLSNLLSSCKSYLDQTPHLLGELRSKADFVAAFIAETNAQYDGHFGYRFMEALRAHGQHRGLPIHGIRTSSGWVGSDDVDDDMALLRYSVAPNIDVKALREDSKFKKAILAEIKQDKLNAVPLVREYMEGLSAVHMKLRDDLSERMTQATALLRKTVNDYASKFPGTTDRDLAALEIPVGGLPTREVPLYEHLITYVERLQNLNRSLVNLQKRFVSNASDIEGR